MREPFGRKLRLEARDIPVVLIAGPLRQLAQCLAHSRLSTEAGCKGNPPCLLPLEAKSWSSKALAMLPPAGYFLQLLSEVPLKQLCAGVSALCADVSALCAGVSARV